MSTGKYISLEEARNHGLLDRFCKEHPAKGKKADFFALLEAMAKTPESDDQTSTQKHPDED